MSFFRILVVFLITAVAVLTGCTDRPTRGELKPFANVCDPANDGKRIAVDAYLALPRHFEHPRTYVVMIPLEVRASLIEDKYGVIVVWMPVGDGANKMDDVRNKYTDADLKVRTKDGATISYKDKIRLSGKVVFPSSNPYSAWCVMNNPYVESL